jgi:hypothetical protein
MPANLSVGRDLTIRRKIENAGIIVLLAVRNESGHHVAFNPARSGRRPDGDRRFPWPGEGAGRRAFRQDFGDPRRVEQRAG